MQLIDILNEKTALAFVIGVVVGIVGSRAYNKKLVKDSENYISESMDEFETDLDEESEPDEIEEQFERFSTIRQKYSSISDAYDALINEEDESKNEESSTDISESLAVEFIDLHDFVNGYSNYTKLNATYFVNDDILAGFDTQLDELSLEEIDRTIGEEFFNQLPNLQLDEDVIYIRNNETRTDVEIVIEKSTDYMDAVTELSSSEEVLGDA